MLADSLHLFFERLFGRHAFYSCTRDKQHSNREHKDIVGNVVNSAVEHGVIPHDGAQHRKADKARISERYEISMRTLRRLRHAPIHHTHENPRKQADEKVEHGRTHQQHQDGVGIGQIRVAQHRI